jgi:hypothetical protein
MLTADETAFSIKKEFLTLEQGCNGITSVAKASRGVQHIICVVTLNTLALTPNVHYGRYTAIRRTSAMQQLPALPETSLGSFNHLS